MVRLLGLPRRPRPGSCHDYSHPVDTHGPWFASSVDPQLKAPPAERGIVELPVATFGRDDRWTFDAGEGALFGQRLVVAIESERTAGPSIEGARRIARARRLGGAAYVLTRGRRRLINRILPRAVAHTLADCGGERLVDDDFYVAVGHSKVDLDVPAIRRQLATLRKGGVEVVGLAEMANLAREQLDRNEAFDIGNDARRQASCAPAASVPKRDDVRSLRLRAMIPLDRVRVLDLGCGAGACSMRIATEHPWMRVTGVDADDGLIAAARECHASERVDFVVADLLDLPFADGTFDCVYADDVLAHCLDVDATLAEVRRVLADDGVLIAAIPPDAYETQRTIRNHTWKTTAADASERLRHSGLVDIGVEEVDTYRLGAAPNPPASDRMLYVRAWRRDTSVAPVDRIDTLRRWVNTRLDARCRSAGRAPKDVLVGADARSSHATLLLGEALKREGYTPRWIAMIAREHPHGSGARLELTREVIELTLGDHSVHVVDGATDVRYPHSLGELLDDATLADEVERELDPEYLGREKDLYATSFWYRRVVAVAVRSNARDPRRFVPARWVDRAADPWYQAVASVRVRTRRAIRQLRSR